MKGKFKNNSGNYVYHEIKDIKGKQKLEPNDLEIIEDLSGLHEVKAVTNNNQKSNQPLRSKRNIQGEIEIKLEGNPSSYNRNLYNTNYYRDENEYKQNEYIGNYRPQSNQILCSGYQNNNNQGERIIGYVNAPFLSDN